MTRNALNNSLRSDKEIDLSSTPLAVQGRLNPSNPFQLFRFKLTGRSQLNFNLNSAGAGCTLELISDRNHNTRIDRGEVLKRATSKSQRSAAMQLTDVEPGTYFLRVAPSRQNSTTYNLFSAAVLSNIQTVDPDPNVTPPITAGGSEISATSSATSTVAVFPTGDVLVDQVVQLTNSYRQQHGLQALTYNSTLSAAAQGHSQNMALQDFFNHTGLDGTSPGQRVNTAGYHYSITAENIAAGFSTAEQVVHAWINSPVHRTNLLNPIVKEMGVGYYHLANDTGNVNYNMYWTQNFASPL